MSGEHRDSERLYQCERPEFLGDSSYMELVVDGEGTQTAAVRAHNSKLIKDFGSSASGNYFFLMPSLNSLVGLAKDDKEDTGYYPVTSWYVTDERGDGDTEWKIWSLAGCERGEPPRWSPYWSRG